MLQIESSEQINDTLTNEELKTAGEMFLYLTMCPYAIQPWIVFYEDLFQTQTPGQILLTLNRLKKGPRNGMAEILFRRILSMLPGRETYNKAANTEARTMQKFGGNH